MERYVIANNIDDTMHCYCKGRQLAVGWPKLLVLAQKIWIHILHLQHSIYNERFITISKNYHKVSNYRCLETNFFFIYFMK